MEDLDDIESADPKIRKLVDAVNFLDLRTEASCEGHLEENKHQHPWVGYNPFSVDCALRYLIAEYNKTRETKWVLNTPFNGYLAPENSKDFCCCNLDTGKSITKEELEKLQESANELADLICKRNKDEDIKLLKSNPGVMTLVGFDKNLKDTISLLDYLKNPDEVILYENLPLEKQIEIIICRVPERVTYNISGKTYSSKEMINKIKNQDDIGLEVVNYEAEKIHDWIISSKRFAFKR